MASNYFFVPLSTLADMDFNVFLQLKLELRWRHFDNSDDDIAAVGAYLIHQDEKFFRDGIIEFEHRLE